MEIKTFEPEHIQQALELAELSFEQENKKLNNILPKTSIPDLKEFADNKLGVAAFEKNKLIGYICCYGPVKNLFGVASGVWSPVHGNAAVQDDKRKIYSKMYQYASEMWVNQSLLSHSITLYSTDSDGIGSFFDNGFGKRCVDGIMDIRKDSIYAKNSSDFFELPKNDFALVHSLSNLTKIHLQKSPAFMPIKPESLEEFIKNITDDTRIFAAKQKDKIIAYLQIQNSGETFISQNKCMMNITGAYTIEEYRGSKIYSELLRYVINILKNENYSHLGVDYESINPTANAFWQKSFVPYTYSLTRRIDERIIEL
ncbi:MAG: GNAT family N-acetyltransferase [Eubacteriales bacterium]